MDAFALEAGKISGVIPKHSESLLQVSDDWYLFEVVYENDVYIYEASPMQRHVMDMYRNAYYFNVEACPKLMEKLNDNNHTHYYFMENGMIVASLLRDDNKALDWAFVMAKCDQIIYLRDYEMPQIFHSVFK